MVAPRSIDDIKKEIGDAISANTPINPKLHLELIDATSRAISAMKRDVPEYKGTRYTDGRSLDIDTFIYAFENFCKRKGLSSSIDMRSAFITALDEPALQWYHNYDTQYPNTTWKDVVVQFRARFEDKAKVQRAMMELHSVRQRGSIFTFNQQFEAIIARIKPRPAEPNLILAYQTAVDASLAEILFDKQPTLLRDAMNLLEERIQMRQAHQQRHMTNNRAAPPTLPPPRPAFAPRSTYPPSTSTPPLSPISRPPPTPPRTSFSPGPTPMEWSPTAKPAPQFSPAPRYVPPTPTTPYSTPSRSVRAQTRISSDEAMRRGLCRYCKEPGHILKNCPHVPRAAAQQATPVVEIGPRTNTHPDGNPYDYIVNTDVEDVNNSTYISQNPSIRRLSIATRALPTAPIRILPHCSSQQLTPETPSQYVPSTDSRIHPSRRTRVLVPQNYASIPSSHPIVRFHTHELVQPFSKTHSPLQLTSSPASLQPVNRTSSSLFGAEPHPKLWSASTPTIPKSSMSPGKPVKAKALSQDHYPLQWTPLTLCESPAFTFQATQAKPPRITPIRGPVVMSGTFNEIPVRVFFDNGSDINCISPFLVQRFKLPTTARPPTQVNGADGKPMYKIERRCTGKFSLRYDHQEELCFEVAHNPGYDIVLGNQWMWTHEPQLDFKTFDLIFKVNNIAYRVPLLPQLRETPDYVISAMSFKKMVRKERAICYAVHIRAQHTPETSPIDHHFQAIINEYPDVFPSELPPGLPPQRHVEHVIEIQPGTTPFSRNPYRLSPEEVEELKKKIAYLLEIGHIRPSVSPWGAPVLFARKKDGTLRLCIDYRVLNKGTIRNTYPLPKADELFNRMHGAKYFTKIDLDMAYHQVRVRPQDIPKTAFNCPLGHYEFTVMTFGFTNAPATFQTLMNSILSPEKNNFLVVYLDDILIYSNTLEEHQQHLRQVLEILRANQLYAKLKKCEFAKTQVEYLGHVISQEGISADPKKTKAIAEWPQPLNPHDIRVFLGLTNYYRRFIHNYAQHAKPLTLLLQKETTFTWTGDCQRAFEFLKRALSTAPILRLADPQRPFRVRTDCSDFAIGAVLLQQYGKHWHPVSYESRQLHSGEPNYPIHEKELLALKHALHIWRHFLEGQEFVAYTDHQSITHLLKQPQLSQRQARWVEFFANYNVTFEYRPGTQNIVADALSRRPDLRPTNPSIRSLQTYVTYHTLFSEFRKYYPTDPHFGTLYKLLQAGGTDSEYVLTDDLLYYHNRLCVPNHGDLRTRLVSESHDTLTSGHPGMEKTLFALRALFYWPKMKHFVNNYVRSCDSCQRHKVEHRRVPGLLQPLPVNAHCWDTCTMDFVTTLPLTQRNRDNIMVVVDPLSKMAHFIASRDTADADYVAGLFVDNVVRLHGVPRRFICDRDGKFVSDFWKSVWKRLGVSIDMSTAHHPQTDGQSERTIQTLKQYLRAHVKYNQKDWDLLLPLAELAYNSASHSATGTSPFITAYGRQPYLPLALYQPPSPSDIPAADDFLSSISTTLGSSHEILASLGKSHIPPRTDQPTLLEEEAATTIRLAQERAAKYHNLKHRPLKLRPRQLVLVSTKNMKQEQFTSRENRSLSARYIGPFPIIRARGPNAYELQLPPHFHMHPVFNVEVLRPYHDPKIFPSRPTPVHITDHPSGPQSQIIESILDSTNTQHGMKYLVHWANKPHHDDSWVFARHLENALPLIQRYINSLAAPPNPPPMP